MFWSTVGVSCVLNFHTSAKFNQIHYGVKYLIEIYNFGCNIPKKCAIRVLTVFEEWRNNFMKGRQSKPLNTLKGDG